MQLWTALTQGYSNRPAIENISAGAEIIFICLSKGRASHDTLHARSSASTQSFLNHMPTRRFPKTNPRRTFVIVHSESPDHDAPLDHIRHCYPDKDHETLYPLRHSTTRSQRTFLQGQAARRSTSPHTTSCQETASAVQIPADPYDIYQAGRQHGR